MRPDRETVERLVRMALLEDAPWGDITSQALFSEAVQVTARLVAREDGVLCGEDLFVAAMSLTGPVRTEFAIHDGERFEVGRVVASVSGPARAVLQAERVALNFLQRLSGIATMTARFVAETAGTKARITDTRKTTPGLRVIERYAVRCGGGWNHRFSLSDAVLAKDNHLAALMAADAMDVSAKLRAAFAEVPHTVHVEVEVDRLGQIEQVLAAGVHTIMLDNMTTEEVRSGVRQIARRALVEVSGGVTLDRIAELAAAGVDIISVGALTHSVRAVDLGLDMDVSVVA